jgi:hypothetical protein
MKGNMSREKITELFLIICAGMIFLKVSVSFATDIAGTTFKGFHYPEYDSKGQLRYELKGEEAQILPSGQILVISLELMLYEGGKTIMKITAPQCYFDRQNKSAFSTSSVAVVRSDMQLTGRDFYWSADGKLEIKNDARLFFTTRAKQNDQKKSNVNP